MLHIKKRPFVQSVDKKHPQAVKRGVCRYHLSLLRLYGNILLLSRRDLNALPSDKLALSSDSLWCAYHIALLLADYHIVLYSLGLTPSTLLKSLEK